MKYTIKTTASKGTSSYQVEDPYLDLLVELEKKMDATAADVIGEGATPEEVAYFLRQRVIDAFFDRAELVWKTTTD